MTERVQYDEFSMFHENASEYGLPYAAAPLVRREFVQCSADRRLSALVWGDESPTIVFLHGGAQNAHTWDTVALAMGIAVLCIDLPGHGHSDSAGAYDASAMPLAQNANDIATVIRALAPHAQMIVGMSLGGLTTLALTRDHDELVPKMVLVDVTPGINQEKTKAITDFVNGPATFPSFEELLERTMQFNPTRTMTAMRRGILHNALQTADGSWVWRYRRDDAPPLPQVKGELKRPDTATLWDVFDAYNKPLMFVRGMRSQSVVSDEDEAELLRRAPRTRVEHVQEAGHSVQGDTPLELADLLLSFLAS